MSESAAGGRSVGMSASNSAGSRGGRKVDTDVDTDADTDVGTRGAADAGTNTAESAGTAPRTLAHAGIAERIPHCGSMCLLDQLHGWSHHDIHCSAIGHTRADHPLRTASGLLAVCAVEYAAQAMALHGALLASAGGPPQPGSLVSVRELRLAAVRLNTVAGALHIRAQRLAGEGAGGPVSYRFTVCDERGALLAEGRALVLLGPPARAGQLTAPQSAP